jgi:hypothetical protein
MPYPRLRRASAGTATATVVDQETRAESALTHAHPAHDLPAESGRWSTITRIYEGTNQVQCLVTASLRVMAEADRLRLYRLFPDNA